MRLFQFISNRYVLLFTITVLLGVRTHAQELTAKQKDSAYLAHPFKDRVQAFKKIIAKKFINFQDNDLSLFGAMSLNHQTINDKGVTAPINYLYELVNNDRYKPGYTGGFRLDGIYKEKHHYSISVAMNRVIAGAQYKNKYNLSPFMEDFTHFKAENQFTTISLAAHYKKLLPVNAMNKYKFYAVFGPSFDYKVSRISDASLLNGAGNRSFINGDIGTEFDNKGYYILYAHYKMGANLFSSAVPIRMNRFEIGMSIKSKDLF